MEANYPRQLPLRLNFRKPAVVPCARRSQWSWAFLFYGSSPRVQEMSSKIIKNKTKRARHFSLEDVHDRGGVIWKVSEKCLHLYAICSHKIIQLHFIFYMQKGESYPFVYFTFTYEQLIALPPRLAYINCNQFHSEGTNWIQNLLKLITDF